MTIANWCVLIACLLPIVCIGLAKAGSSTTNPKEGGYNNNRPRDWEASLTGWKKRASAAQSNSFEALPLFIAAVLLAQQAHGDQARIDMLAMAFIAIRIAYVIAYITNRGMVRSLIWMAGVGVSIAILLS